MFAKSITISAITLSMALPYEVIARPQEQQTNHTEDHPAEKQKAAATPTQVTSFYCRNGVREVITSDQNFERSSIWSGTVAVPRSCGGCYFANAPGSSSPDLTNPVTVIVDWGDGTKDSADFTSNNPTVGSLTLSKTGLTASHSYNTLIDPPKQATFTFSAFCEDDQGQWRETIDNHCRISVYYGCAPHSAAIGVYAPVLPSTASIVRPIIHGQKIQGALSLVFQDDSPPSGTTITLSSDNKTILFPQFGAPSAQASTILVSPRVHAQNFDIDATKATAGSTFTITVTSTKGGGPPVVTLPYKVQ
jgi:hypothetical protein